jgi:hypothetical protein
VSTEFDRGIAVSVAMCRSTTCARYGASEPIIGPPVGESWGQGVIPDLAT